MSRDKTREIKAPERTREMKPAMARVPEGGMEPREAARGLDSRAGEVKVRMRMSQGDAHYGGNLVDGARMLSLFGDIATELLIRLDGDEGLFRAYDSVEFLAPVYAGDYVEAVGRITSKSTTARRMAFEAWKVISPRPDLSDSAAEVLKEPVLVCRASGTCVVPQSKQRLGHD
jgi:3-aminobutyryl-CoA ammonia-lyase